MNDAVVIIRAFVAMRRFIVTNAAVLQRLGAVEVKQIAMDEKLNKVLGKIESKEFPLAIKRKGDMQWRLSA